METTSIRDGDDLTMQVVAFVELWGRLRPFDRSASASLPEEAEVTSGIAARIHAALSQDADAVAA